MALIGRMYDVLDELMAVLSIVSFPQISSFIKSYDKCSDGIPPSHQGRALQQRIRVWRV